MTNVFEFSVSEVLKEEGGYVDNPSDPGGATNMGITLATLSQWRNFPCSKQDVRDLTENEAKKIYKALFWDKIRGDEFKPAVSLLLFDAAVNHGVSGAIRLAQETLHTASDGVIGPQTFAALQKVDQRQFIKDFLTERAIYYVSLPSYSKFGHGWIARLFSLGVDVVNFVQTN